jgi:hypothetical protein
LIYATKVLNLLQSAKKRAKIFAVSRKSTTFALQLQPMGD